MSINRAKVPIGLAVACVVALLAAVLVGAQTNPSPAGSEATSERAGLNADLPRVESTDSAQTQLFGVLREPQDPPGASQSQPTGPFGANLHLAHVVDSAAGPVWVVPGNGYVCLRAEDSVGSAWACVPTALAKEGKLMLSLRSPEGGSETSVYALLPDGVKTASVETLTSSRELQVSDNVVATQIVSPQTLVFADAHGKKRVVDVP
jgi:hypothetical protein